MVRLCDWICAALFRNQETAQGMSYSIRTLVALLSIAAGAVLGGPAEAVSAALADVQTRSVEERKATRYLSLEHFQADGVKKREWWQRISAHAASTSRKALIIKPTVILLPSKQGGPLEEADGLVIAKEDWNRAFLIRLNLLYQGYDTKVWEKLSLVEPFFHYRERDQQTVKVPETEVAPAVVEEAVEIQGFQFFQDGEGNSLIELKKSDLKPGMNIWIKDRPGGSLRRFVIPENGILKESVTMGGRQSFRYSSDGGRNWFADEATARQAKEDRVKQDKKDKKNEDDKVKDEANKYGEWCGSDIQKLSLACSSECPIAYADWYWWQTIIQTDRAPGPGYYDLLGVKDEKTFDELVGFDSKLFKTRFAEFVKEYRAAQAISGISKQPRRIAVEDKLGGEKWFTFDNIIAKGIRNPIDTPNGGFRYAASEQLAHLPNGFLAQGLFDEDGKRQDFAPQNVVGNDRTSTNQGDGNIHAGLCFRCHAGSMQPVDDWFSSMYDKAADIGGPDYKKILDIQEKYSGELQQKLRDSASRHDAALKKSCGLNPLEYSKLLSTGMYQVEDSHVDLKRAARELGCTPERLNFAVSSYKRKGNYQGAAIIDIFGRPVAKQKPIPYRQYLECITEAHTMLAASRVNP